MVTMVRGRIVLDCLVSLQNILGENGTIDNWHIIRRMTIMLTFSPAHFGGAWEKPHLKCYELSWDLTWRFGLQVETVCWKLRDTVHPPPTFLIEVKICEAPGRLRVDSVRALHLPCCLVWRSNACVVSFDARHSQHLRFWDTGVVKRFFCPFFFLARMTCQMARHNSLIAQQTSSSRDDVSGTSGQVL